MSIENENQEPPVPTAAPVEEMSTAPAEDILPEEASSDQPAEADALKIDEIVGDGTELSDAATDAIGSSDTLVDIAESLQRAKVPSEAQLSIAEIAVEGIHNRLGLAYNYISLEHFGEDNASKKAVVLESVSDALKTIADTIKKIFAKIAQMVRDFVAWVLSGTRKLKARAKAVMEKAKAAKNQKPVATERISEGGPTGSTASIVRHLVDGRGNIDPQYIAKRVEEMAATLNDMAKETKDLDGNEMLVSLINLLAHGVDNPDDLRMAPKDSGDNELKGHGAPEGFSWRYGSEHIFPNGTFVGRLVADHEVRGEEALKALSKARSQILDPRPKKPEVSIERQLNPDAALRLAAASLNLLDALDRAAPAHKALYGVMKRASDAMSKGVDQDPTSGPKTRLVANAVIAYMNATSKSYMLFMQNSFGVATAALNYADINLVDA